MSHVDFGGGTPPPPFLVERILLEEGERTMERATMATLGEVLRRMERSRRTGTLMRSTTKRVVRVGRLIVGLIGSNVFYAPYLEEGTGLYGPLNHWIYPKQAKALRFPQPGNAGFTLAGRQRKGKAGAQARWVFARRVRGIRPRRFFRDSAVVMEPRVQRIFDEGALRITQRIEAAWGMGRG